MSQQTAFTIREGHVSLRVWPAPSRTRGKLYPAWEFEYHDPEHGRRRVKRARRAEAEQEARAVVRRLARGEFLVTGRQAADYAEADLIAARWHVSVAELARDFDARRKAAAAAPALHKSTEEIVEELIAFKRTKGKGKLHQDDLRVRLGRFARDVRTPLHEVTTRMIEDWLTTLNVSLRTQRNFIGAISNLFQFARGRGFLPADCDPVGAVERPEIPDKAIGECIYTPREMKLLLANISASGLPILAINAFAGLRPSEIRKLKWSDINWEENLIRVPADTKTGRRTPPLLPNLRAWLEPLRGEGRIATMGMSGWTQSLRRARDKANQSLRAEHSCERLASKPNASRHCFATYRSADLKNLDQVAWECGHKVAMLKKNYRDVVTPAAAKEWFNLMPGLRENVIQLSLFERGLSPHIPTTAGRIAWNP